MAAALVAAAMGGGGEGGASTKPSAPPLPLATATASGATSVVFISGDGDRFTVPLHRFSARVVALIGKA